MEKIMIVNASPRAPRSNSKIYAELFAERSVEPAEYFNLTKNNHKELCDKVGEYAKLLFVFPLYADGIPVTLLNFLKSLEENTPEKKPVVSVMINCGFLEYAQNDVAVEQLRLFCDKNAYPLGAVLKVGSGEAILYTPFKIFVKSKIKKFAKAVNKNKIVEYNVTMPITKKMFLKASTVFWLNKGKQNGITQEEMQTMSIEDDKSV